MYKIWAIDKNNPDNEGEWDGERYATREEAQQIVREAEAEENYFTSYYLYIMEV